MTFRSLILVAVIGAFGGLASGAQAAPTVDGIFNLPQKPVRAALGPDGNVWVTLASATTDVAKVTPDGTVTTYEIPEFESPVGITAGGDGLMWVTGDHYLGRFLPAVPTGGTKIVTPEIAVPGDIAPDTRGNLWTTSGSMVIKFRPSESPYLTTVTVPNFTGRGIGFATDGTTWIANADATKPGLVPFTVELTSIIPGTPVLTGGAVEGVAAGINAQIAYTNPGASPQTIGLVGLAGALANPFVAAGTDPTGIVFGQDQSYWVAQANSASIGRYSSTGEYSAIGGIPTGARRITRGASDTLWVTLESSNQIARVSGVTSATRPAPVLSKVSLSNKRFRVARWNTPTIARKKSRIKKGTVLKYFLLEQADVTIEVQRAKSGRKSGKSCVKPSASLQNAKKCTRYLTVKTLKRKSFQGVTKVGFAGRVDGFKFPPGRYRFSLVGVNVYFQQSNRVTKSFTIVK